MRVTLTKGTLLAPPTCFALLRALAIPELDWRTLTLATRITDPTVTVPVGEAAPRAFGNPLLLRVTAQARGMGQIHRAITIRGPDVIHQHQATRSLPTVGATREAGVPLVVTLHGGDAYPRLGRGVSVAWNAHNRTSVFEGTSRLLTISRYLMGVALGAGADPEHLSVHYQGVDTHWWTSASNTTGSRKEPVALFMDALSRLKGVGDLTRASASFVGRRPHHLVLVGDGPLAPALRAHAPAHVAFTGRLDCEGVHDRMRHTRVLILPTRPTQGKREVAGFVLLEAQTYGVPVTTYRTGGTPEMVTPGASMPSDERSPDALARSIDEALAWSENEREDRGTACRAWMTHERSLRGSANQLRAIYTDVAR